MVVASGGLVWEDSKDGVVNDEGKGWGQQKGRGGGEGGRCG